jgi:ABC-type glycerol-3-phosphate transport system substrate-binding protein
MQLVAQASKAEEVTISHYFTGDLGLKGMQAFFEGFEKETGIAVKDSGIGHEDYKTGILVRAAANRLPDVFSYGAGARPQFVVDAGNVAPVDDIWDPPIWATSFRSRLPTAQQSTMASATSFRSAITMPAFSSIRRP